MTAISDAGLIPARKPPVSQSGVVGWLRMNLFSSWVNSIITIVGGFVVIKFLWWVISWAIINAVWSGKLESCAAVIGEGACWEAIREKSRFIFFGPYTYDQQWRGVLVMAIFVGLVVASGYKRLWRRELLYAWLAGFVIILWLMIGGLGLPVVATNLWGGLPLTLLLAFIGIAAAFPLGIVLALGRRSNLPIIRTLSVTYIELIRGVPLITVLFMSSVMFPLFLPEGVDIDKVLRAQVAMILFIAAYQAEAIRGGLQAIPKGQYEAADAIALGYWQKMYFIILPQALKIAIPPMVNNFISTFKDTSLVVIIGLYDLLATTKTAMNDPPVRAYFFDAYVVAAMIYFVFCFYMSRLSHKIEKALDTGHKRH